jgi:putative proteasome-type protease
MIFPNTPLGDSARAALLSFDSTMKSDLTVGPPIDFVVFKKDQINLNFQDQLKLDSPFFKELSSIWAEQLDSAIHALPKFNWEE